MTPTGPNPRQLRAQASTYALSFTMRYGLTTPGATGEMIEQTVSAVRDFLLEGGHAYADCWPRLFPAQRFRLAYRAATQLQENHFAGLHACSTPEASHRRFDYRVQFARLLLDYLSVRTGVVCAQAHDHLTGHWLLVVTGYTYGYADNPGLVGDLRENRAATIYYPAYHAN